MGTRRPVAVFTKNCDSNLFRLKKRELASWLKGFERGALNYQRILEPAEDSRINHLLLELKQLSVPSLAPLLMVVLDCVDDVDRLEQILRTLRSSG
jgi:hypothetical protein